MTAKYPKIRLITCRKVGTEEPQDDFHGHWQVCTPGDVGSFSAVGYFFGRQLNETLNVPIGLINDAWGGSACEAWVRRDLLRKRQVQTADGPLGEIEKKYDPKRPRPNIKRLAKWKTVTERPSSRARAAQAARTDPREPTDRQSAPGEHL